MSVRASAAILSPHDEPKNNSHPLIFAQMGLQPMIGYDRTSEIQGS